jgi:hypothetical protein
MPSRVRLACILRGQHPISVSWTCRRAGASWHSPAPNYAFKRTAGTDHGVSCRHIGPRPLNAPLGRSSRMLHSPKIAFAAALLCACTSGGADSSQASTGVASIPESAPPDGPCAVDLTTRGLPPEETNTRLVEVAQRHYNASQNTDAPLRFYKAIAAPESDAVHYVFFLPRHSDLYVSYVADSTHERFHGWFRFGSLHYPCGGSA